MRGPCKLAIFAVVLAAWSLGPGRVHAQSSDAFGMPVQIDVASGLSVFIDVPLDFGSVAQNTGTTTITLTGGSAGQFRIYGDQNKTVNVTLTPPADLSNGVDVIPYTWQAAYNESVNNPADGATVTFSGTTATFRLGDGSPPGRAGQAFVWVYGSIDVGAVSPGTYAAVFTLSAAY